MGIANELSSDVAAAVLSGEIERPQAGTNQLIEIVRSFHSAMRDLVGEERRRRIHPGSSSDAAQANSRVAFGDH